MDLLYVYSNKRVEDQVETKAFLESISNNSNYNIYQYNTLEEYDYYNIVKTFWNRKKPFFILEQDIVPTLDILDEMRLCKEPFCAARYYIYPKSTALKEKVYAHRIITEYKNETDFKSKWVTDEDYADLYGLGLVKLTPFSNFFETPNSYRNLDFRISHHTYTHGFKAHLHGEVKHNHM